MEERFESGACESGQRTYPESGHECRKYEFSTLEGSVWVREKETCDNGTGKQGRRSRLEEQEAYKESFRKFTFRDRDIVELLYAKIGTHYPDAMERLMTVNERWKGNRWNFEFRVVDRFVRCNMGADDYLAYDIDAGEMNLEYVQCPLRGICEDEGVICCPEVRKGKLTETQRKVARLYALGKTPTEIAKTLKNSPSTIKTHLNKVREILGLKSVRGIIAYISLYGGKL